MSRSSRAADRADRIHDRSLHVIYVLHVRYDTHLYLTVNHFHRAYMTLSINSSSLFIVSDFIRHLILLRPVMQTPPTMWWWKVLVVAAIGTVHAASRDQWLGRSVYQVVTDRFARSDNSTTASCDAGLGEYCGGNLQGIINKLDYIQELGFDAVWISPVQSQESTRTADLSGMVILTVNGYRELTIDK